MKSSFPVLLEEKNGGTAFAIKVQAGARKNEIGDVFDNCLKVKVTQVAEKGKANKAIIALLAKETGISKSSFEIISGSTSSQKKILVTGVNKRELESIIENYI